MNQMPTHWRNRVILFGILMMSVITGPAGAETRRYTYDDLGRLTRATYDTQTVLTYIYD